MWLSWGKGCSSVCLHSWETELLLHWEQTWIISWLAWEGSLQIGHAAYCSGGEVTHLVWLQLAQEQHCRCSAGAEGDGGTFGQSDLCSKGLFGVCNCLWRALGIWSRIWGLLILKTPGYSCPHFQCRVCLNKHITETTEVVMDLRTPVHSVLVPFFWAAWTERDWCRMCRHRRLVVLWVPMSLRALQLL